MSINNGIENEIEIEQHLNAHKYTELCENLMSFISSVFNPSLSDRKIKTITAARTIDIKYKPDLKVSYISKTKFISIKKGSGNSVHQEPIDMFVKYIITDLKASQEVVEALLFFHWGDGTLDGSAPVSCRMKASKIVEQYPEKIAIIQRFFNQHEDELLKRFLSTGAYDKTPVDYIYYGNYQIADWHTIQEVFDNLKNNPSDALSVGGLNFQNYGRSLNGKDDSRRQSIQIKWSNMSSYFLVGSKKISVPDIESRIKGDNSHGFRNVDEIIVAINGLQFKDISDTLKPFVYSIFEKKCTDNTVIMAKKISRGKGDMLVWLSDNVEHCINVSIISGSGNGVHQENIYSFCNFLTEKAGIDDTTITEYLRFHFADGTDNNTGRLIDRKSASQYKKGHENELAKIESSLLKRSKIIIERFIKSNTDYDIPDVDYILYGNTELPYWAKIDTLIELECNKTPNSRAALAIGDFSIQAWNRSLEGKADRKRLEMQAKWNNLLKNVQIANSIDSKIASKKGALNLQEQNKAIEGLGYEYKFTSSLNKNKKNIVWETLGINDEDVYLINVSYNQTSQLAGSKVKPKSDCYAVRILDNIKELLDEKNYVLTEELLREKNIRYEVIQETGISIKMPSSKDYTIQKFSYCAFKNIFTDISPAYFVAALLYVDKEQVSKNELILSTFKFDIDTLCDELRINREKTNLDTYKALKNTANNVITHIVNENVYVRNAVCFGDNIFEPPYSSNYIFESGKIIHKKDFDAQITVTTGSGRSTGKYTLVFK